MRERLDRMMFYFWLGASVFAIVGWIHAIYYRRVLGDHRRKLREACDIAHAMIFSLRQVEVDFRLTPAARKLREEALIRINEIAPAPIRISLE